MSKRVCQICLSDVVRQGSDEYHVWYSCKCGAKEYSVRKIKKGKS